MLTKYESTIVRSGFSRFGKRMMFFLGLSGLFLLSSCGKSTDETGEEEKVINVKTRIINPSTFLVTGEYHGRLSGHQKAMLVSYSGGRVDRVRYSEGDAFQRGRSLASIDGAQASATVEMAEMNEKVAKESWERTQKLHEEGNASDVQLDQTRLGYLNAKNSRIDAQRMMRSQLCIAPFSGIVLTRYIEPWQELSPGSPTFHIADISTMEIGFEIPESDMKGVTEGNRAEIYVDLYPDRAWEAEVDRIAHEVGSQSRKVKAYLKIDNNESLLKPGMTARIVLTQQVLDSVLVIPSDAILTGSTGDYISIVSGDAAQRRSIKKGPANSYQTVIRSGLNPGEELVVSGHNLVTDGTRIKRTN